jgi:hypothetical protein
VFLHFFRTPRCGEVYNLGGGRQHSLSILETLDLLADMGLPMHYTYQEQPLPSHCQRRLGYARIGPAGSLLALPHLEGARVSLHLDELATKIATLDPAEQEALWEKVAELNFQRGLEALAQKYRARLAAEGTLDQTADTVMAELKKLREEIAANDYRT